MGQVQAGNGENMRIARIVKSSFMSSGCIIVKEHDHMAVYPVSSFSSVKKIYVDEGILLMWKDGLLGYKRSIMVDVVE